MTTVLFGVTSPSLPSLFDRVVSESRVVWGLYRSHAWNFEHLKTRMYLAGSIPKDVCVFLLKRRNTSFMPAESQVFPPEGFALTSMFWDATVKICTRSFTMTCISSSPLN